jgi:DNA repair protein RecO (recombination protein O)
MLEKTEGILLKKVKFSESSNICKIFTRELGLLSFIIKGAGGKRSSIKQAHLIPLSLLELDIYNHPVKNLKRLRELRCFSPLHQIQMNPVKRNQGYFILEIFNRAISEDEPFPILFDFIKNTLIQLNDTDIHNEWFTHRYMIDLCQITGHGINASQFTDGSRFDLNSGRFEHSEQSHPQLLDETLSHQLASLVEDDSYTPPFSLRMRLFYALLDFLRIHLIGVKPVKSLSVLTAVQ